MSDDLHHQCLLTRGQEQQTAWLPIGAPQGSIVELLPSRERWRVKRVYPERQLTKAQLREVQMLNRRSLPSVEAMV